MIMLLPKPSKSSIAFSPGFNNWNRKSLNTEDSNKKVLRWTGQLGVETEIGIPHTHTW